METVESKVADRLRSGAIAVHYRVTPKYAGSSLIPTEIHIEAFEEAGDGMIIPLLQRRIRNIETASFIDD